ncbi:MAG: lyase family protein [Pseudomonadota bacterium]|nr:lyase family protein [Pseudomonadota bacterium]
MVSAQDSAITSSSFSDKEIAELFSDVGEIDALVLFERELARVQESLQIIPEGIGKEIYAALENAKFDSDLLATGFENDAIPIPALLKQLREQLEPAAANYLHFGATSQDVIDTALIIRIKAAVVIIEKNLKGLTAELSKLAQKHRTTVMIGRTRNQNASPTVFALKIVNWLAPLQRQQQRLTELLPRLLVVQFGGAAGTNAALGNKGGEVNSALAATLGLAAAGSAWHAQRDTIVEFSNWLSMTAGQIGKMAKDILLMAQNEVGEIRFSGAGKSSTMPNKSNPVLLETLLSLAGYCRAQSDLMGSTLLVSHERDGVCMSLDRLAFPPLICAAAASITQALKCLASISVNEEAMSRNLIADNGLIMAEMAVFELVKSMERSKASELVRQACELCLTNNSHMIDELESLTNVDLDWDALKQPKNYLGNAEEVIDSVLQTNR